MASEPTRVAMWSGPRNISTAMMRAWENRPDTSVVDEPFYAAYLSRTGLDHPGRDEVIRSQPTEFGDVVETLLAPPTDGVSVAYAKHMSHHMLPDDDLTWSHDFRNILLIRDPAEVVASYVWSRESCEPDDIGIPRQARLWEQWQSAGLDVPVIDAADFLRDPEAHLTARWPKPAGRHTGCSTPNASDWPHSSALYLPHSHRSTRRKARHVERHHDGDRHPGSG